MARVEAVDVGPAGIDQQAVDRLFRTRPFRLAYVMPVYQNPTGAAYSSAAKRRLLALCRECLTRYKVPTEVEFRDELPKTNVGKILRRALREK